MTFLITQFYVFILFLSIAYCYSTVCYREFVTNTNIVQIQLLFGCPFFERAEHVDDISFLLFITTSQNH